MKKLHHKENYGEYPEKSSGRIIIRKHAGEASLLFF